MVLNWFFRDEFEKFYGRVERLQKFLRITDRELHIDHFVELRKHLRQMKRLLPPLIRLYHDEVKVITRLPESPYKQKLKAFSNDLNKELNNLEEWVDNALNLIDEILKVRIVSRFQKEKANLEKIINHITHVLTKAQEDAFELIKFEKAWKRSIKKSKPVSKIPIVGTLSNGWRLTSIQAVIIDLGGVIVQNSGSRHPYKIKFPKASIPLAASTPPYMIVREVSHATGVDNKTLVASFSRGELVAA